jgi:hypothetical protein
MSVGMKLVIIAAGAVLANPAITPRIKMEKLARPTAPQVVPIRIAGYAMLALENGAKNKLIVREGETRTTLPNIMANDIDFITVVGANTVVTVYEQPNLRGHSLTLRCGNYELLQQPRNDIESVKVSYAKTPVSECQGSDLELVQIKTWDR